MPVDGLYEVVLAPISHCGLTYFAGNDGVPLDFGLVGVQQFGITTAQFHMEDGRPNRVELSKFGLGIADESLARLVFGGHPQCLVAKKDGVQQLLLIAVFKGQAFDGVEQFARRNRLVVNQICFAFFPKVVVCPVLGLCTKCEQQGECD